MESDLMRINEDFATFTRESMALDARRDNEAVLIGRLADLAGGLRAAAERLHGVAVSRPTFVAALMEANRVQEHLDWLTQYAHVESRDDVRQRIVLAASQGWTAAELLQRCVPTHPLMAATQSSSLHNLEIDSPKHSGFKTR